MHRDGAVRGLYLRVSSPTSRSWVVRFMIGGKAREMGLGPYPDVSLARAREKALQARSLKAEGVDPLEAKKVALAARRAEAAKTVTFEQAAKAYIEAHRAGWGDKHGSQWSATLAAYAYPLIGDLPVAGVGVEEVLTVLRPIWNDKTETAGRVRGRVEAVLDWSRVRGYREGENPARWRGHLDHLLAARSKIQKVEHLEALPFDQLSGFIGTLRAREGVAARALEFLILTAARTGSVRGACWDEVDFRNQVWIVPAERMKGGREHRVPLSDRAAKILEALPRTGSFIFGGARSLRENAMLELLRQLNNDGVTVHGFRSVFRDWCGEHTGFPREVAEQALAHTTGNAVELSYRRGDALEKRRELMQAWASYLDPEKSDVVTPLRRRG